MRGPCSRCVFFALVLLLGVAGALSSGTAAQAAGGPVPETAGNADVSPDVLVAAGLLFSEGIRLAETSGAGSASVGDTVAGGRYRSVSRAASESLRTPGPAHNRAPARRGGGLLGMDASPANAPPGS